ncbi:PD-(D/E)XK nuclease family protein [Effusibacillus consociatus]|uniref:PD-(D/E)XK nuclease family protein n=1 Tax=Effusibacillus consociatus TaxID=1117041 RepID=A0ABV9Q8G7_9BACL
MTFTNDECIRVLAKAIRERKQVLYIGSHHLLIQQRKSQLLHAAGGYIGIHWTTLNQLADRIIQAGGKAYVRIDQGIRQDLMESMLLKLEAEGKVPRLQTGLHHAGMYKSVALWIEDLEKGRGEEWDLFLSTVKESVLQELRKVYETYLACVRQKEFPYKETEQVFRIASEILETSNHLKEILTDVIVIEGAFPDTPGAKLFLECIRKMAPESILLSPVSTDLSTKADKVRFLFGATVYEEVRSVVADIVTQLNIGVSKNEILVVSPNPYYSQWVKRELRAQGLSVQGDRTTPLLHLPVAQRILSLLQLKKNDWERGSLLKCARLHPTIAGLTEEDAAWGRERIEESGVRSGFHNWSALFRGHAARSTIRLEYLNGEAEAEQVERRQMYAEKWIRFLYRLNSWVQSIPASDTWTSYLDQGLLLIDLDQKAAFRLRFNALLMLEYEGVRNCLRTRREIATAFAAEGERQISLERFVKWFRERLSTFQLTVGREEDGIRVCQPDEIYGGAFSTVYVLGLVEDLWPRSFDPHWIWDLCKRETEGTGLMVPGADEQEADDRRFFEWAVESGQKDIVLSGPIRGERGHTTVISRYVTDWLGEQEREVSPKMLFTTGNDRKGYVKKGEAQVQQPQFFHPQTPLHVTGINQYAKCPFKFFAQSVLSVREKTVRKDGFLPVDVGSIAHEVLRKLITEPVLTTEELMDRTEELLDERLQQFAGRYGFSGPKWEGQCRILKRDLLEFVAAEANLLLQTEGIKQMAEWGFGSVHAEKMDAASTPAPLIIKSGDREVRITGMIDRVDQSEEGFSVVDYKLSSSPTRRDVEEGREFQLALYLIGYLSLVQNGKRPLGGRFAVLRDPGKGGSIEFETWDQFHEFRERITGQLFDLVKRMEQGDTAPRPRELSECRRCSYRGVCRRDEYAQRGALYEQID